MRYDEDARLNWFPKNAVMYGKSVSEGAGQVRAISRLALNATIKTGNIRPLTDAVDDLFRKDGKAMKQAMRIVLVSSCSGGTGSGIFMALEMFLRDYVNSKYPNTGLIIRSLLLLPETLDSVIDSSQERQSQRRNAYASIKELNGFMMKGSGVLDADPLLARYSDLHLDIAQPNSNETRSLSMLPCDFCFLMDGQNAEDNTLVTLEQYKQQAAQALYEQNIGPMQKNAFSVEDNIIKETANRDHRGRNRFGGIGASAIRYPYEDVAQYIAYEWAAKSIGGEAEAAKWSRYDKAFKIKQEEERKKNLPLCEMTTLPDFYVSKVDTGTDNFTKDLRARYDLENAAKRIERYIAALCGKITDAVFKSEDVVKASQAANHLGSAIDYTQESNRGKAKENLSRLRYFESVVTRNAEKVARRSVEAILRNENKTSQRTEDYMLEELMRTSAGTVLHPNAMRYVLYKLQLSLCAGIGIANDTLERTLRNLKKYRPDADSEQFDVAYTKILTSASKI